MFLPLGDANDVEQVKVCLKECTVVLSCLSGNPAEQRAFCQTISAAAVVRYCLLVIYL
jgi:hypothetical protein